MGHIGMRYSLPSREIIADAAETVINAHWFDGVFYMPNCDKITPGMLMAAVRTNVPAVFVSGGPMAGGLSKDGKALSLASVFEGVGAFKSGKMSVEELLDIEKSACPTCGSCSGMFRKKFQLSHSAAWSGGCGCGGGLGRTRRGGGVLRGWRDRWERRRRSRRSRCSGCDRRPGCRSRWCSG